LPRNEQAIDNREEEVSVPKRRLKQPAVVKRLVSGVANEVQDEVDHFKPGVDGASRSRLATNSHCLDRGRYRAERRKRWLPQNKRKRHG
jgi:hypothetical protein